MELAGLLRLAAATDATDIALGIPPRRPSASVVDAAVAALAGDFHQYADPAGVSELRESVARYLRRRHGDDVDPQHELTITCGATEGVFVALLVATDPGDEVILIEPYFELYPGMVELAGAVPRPVPLRQPDWALDLAALGRAVTPRTRAIVLNTPHNPTGRVFSAAEIDGVLDLCRQHDLVCITDEVYDEYVYDGRRHRSPLVLPDWRSHAIIVNSLSKTLEITGWRIGYCVAAPEITQTLRRVHERTTVGTNRPLQHGAAAFPLEHLDGRRRAMAQHRDRMVDMLDSLGFEVFRPEGGWFALAGSKRLRSSATALARDLVEQARVLVAPGPSFFASRDDGDQWIRVTFARDPDTTWTALQRMAEFLNGGG